MCEPHGAIAWAVSVFNTQQRFFNKACCCCWLQDPRCYNILCQPNGSRIAISGLDRSHELLIIRQHAVQPDPEAPAAEQSPPWASSSCIDTISQAQQLLSRSWFEAGFSDKLTSFLKGSGQWLELPESWGPVLQHLISCSNGLGYGFEAVFYDAARQQCFLVPNAFLRHMFPQG